MDLIKKLFSFSDDEACVIGLCKFNDDFFKLSDEKEQTKKRTKKDVPLSQMLRKNV